MVSIAPAICDSIRPIFDPVAGWMGGYDPDAAAYIAAVEAADGQGLETAVKNAIDELVIGLKADASPNSGVSNWAAISGMCLFHGPRTLAGALIPIKGTAPTGFNLVSGDYSRKVGIAGNGSTKYINSNIRADAVPQDNFSFGTWLQTNVTPNPSAGLIGSQFGTGTSSITTQPTPTSWQARCRNSTAITYGGFAGQGILGASRNSAANFQRILDGTNDTITQTSQINSNQFIGVLALLNSAGAATSHTAQTLRMYWVGHAISGATFRERLRTYFDSIASAIP